ncbi:hypothetical protein LBM341_03799 (plasmid) [Ralstonia solanacearum]|nr:hypothetical protein LBM341_03799 [Ralstonia solanacearum]NKA16250.1 hypothetical protein [Ralstonia solanacearum]NKA51257.1 hypothetical protein [Ralstonia solanacearum]
MFASSAIRVTRRNWKRIRPTSLRHALELCKDYAKERHNLSVERIAESMGLADHWTLYKWFQNGRMQAIADSVQVAGSKPYVRIYERIGDSDQFKPIVLDLAAV